MGFGVKFHCQTPFPFDIILILFWIFSVAPCPMDLFDQFYLYSVRVSLPDQLMNIQTRIYW